MGVDSDRARITDLAFQVFNRAIHPDWLSTRLHRRITHKHWAADVRIIDGGHVVIFGAGSVHLTEVLAGPETSLPELGRLYQSMVKAERSTILRPLGLVYQTCFEVERVDPEIFRHLCEEILVSSPPQSLVHRFGSRNRLAPQPVSQVVIDPLIRGLSVHCFHSFPDESAIVRSQSLYELGPLDPPGS